MDDDPDPFLLPDHAALAEVFTDAAVHVLAVRGVASFSVSAIARWMKVSPESIFNNQSAARVVELVTVCFCRRWLRWVVSDSRWLSAPHLCPLRLPRTPAERHGVRVLDALIELAEGERLRGNPLPSLCLADLRRDEAELLGHRLAQLSPARLEAPVPNVELQGLLALLAGLRRSLALERPPLTWEEACQVVATAISGLAGSAPDAPTTTPGLPPPHEPAA